MARIKGGLNAKKRHNRTLKLAKGYRGARSKQYKIAKQSVMRALTSAYAGRKQRKRQFRQLMYLGYDNSMRVWQKIYPNADATMLDYSYAYLANGVIGILENWVCSNYKLSIEQVGKLLMGITMNGLNFLEQGMSAYEVKN